MIALCLFTGVARAACTSVDQTHAQWSAILAQEVSNGRVDYAGLQREGQRARAAYLATLSGACGADYERWTRAGSRQPPGTWSFLRTSASTRFIGMTRRG